MHIHRIAAFSDNGQGGNPAGVVIADKLPSAEKMQSVAAEMGYSETVFAAPQGSKYRTRYFAPEAEVAFCGHATIALGAVLGAQKGQGVFDLVLNDAEIAVTAFLKNGTQFAELVSPATTQRPAEPQLVHSMLDLFGWSARDIDPDLSIQRVNAGAEHLLVPLKSRDLLQTMAYDFETGARLMRKSELVTISLIWQQSADVFHARNPFAGHGVYEDPATGAAAAALG